MNTYSGVTKKAQKNLSDLAKDALGFIDAIEAAAVKKVKEFTLEFVKEAVEVSPVDTSKLISNYQVEVGSEIDGVLGAHVEGKFGSTQPASAAISLLEAEFALEEKKKIGQVVFIVNNVDYLDEQIQLKGNFVAQALEFAAAKVELSDLDFT